MFDCDCKLSNVNLFSMDWFFAFVENKKGKDVNKLKSLER